MGALRLFLALLVVVNHIWGPAENMLGFQAVMSFYMLSGYLMTKVVQDVYGTDARGVGRFLVNRALRLLPAYWLFAVLTLALLLVMPPSFSWGGMVQVPATSVDWLSNLTLIDLAWAEGVLIPPAWSLGIEALFYIAMPLVLARSRRSVEIWAAVSLVITVALVIDGAGFGYRYYPCYAASLFFSLGALCHVHARALRHVALPPFLLWPAIIVLAVLAVASEVAGLSHLYWAYYAGAVLFAVILLTIVKQPAPGRIRARVDRWFGDLAYPVFLSHFIAAGLVNVVLGWLLPAGTAVFLVATIAVTLAISTAFVAWVDPHIQRLRDMVRADRSLGSAAGDHDPVTVPR